MNYALYFEMNKLIVSLYDYYMNFHRYLVKLSEIQKKKKKQRKFIQL